jgi:YegS/Rv2252/BmrU family lipid kinase
MCASATDIRHPPAFSNVWIIANPIAGGHTARRHRDRAIALLQSRLAVSQVRWTGRRGDAEQWAREAVAANVSLVIGFGGDGTLNELANSLVGSPAALGILPAGTGNVVASELAIPLDPLKAAQCLLEGKIERIHTGLAEYQPLTGEQLEGEQSSSFIVHRSSFVPPSSFPSPAGRHFLFVAGLGFDATVCHSITPGVKRWGGRATYVFDGLRLFLRYRSARLNVALDGGAPIACSELIVAKGRFYAGRFVIAPDGSPRKPGFDACLFLRPGRWNLVRYAWGIAFGKHLTYSDVLCRKAQSVEVAADRPVFLQLDGDTVGATPVRLSAQRDALSVVVP